MVELGEIYQTWKLLLDEDFQGYEPGPFSEGYTALEEFYYLRPRIFKGPWQEISNYHLWGENHNANHPNWKIILSDQKKYLEQTLDNRLNRKNWKYPIKKAFVPLRLPKLLAVPSLAAGEAFWSDYCLEAEICPGSLNDLAGLLFRIKDGQSYYLFVLKGGKAAFLRRERNVLTTITSRKYVWCPHAWYKLTVVAADGKLTGFINEKLLLETTDSAYPNGKVGLASNVPARFRGVRTFHPPSAYSIDARGGGAGQSFSRWDEIRHPAMKIWKQFALRNLHSGRTIRFGDLRGNGHLQLLLAKGTSLVKGNDYNALTSLSALDLDGNILWQSGEPSDEQNCLSSDLPFQVYDIDDDGRNEIICARNFHIEILDGATGKVKHRVPTPQAVAPFDRFKNILGDSIYICNLTGSARPQDILLKDRYSKIWAFNNNLERLWEYQSDREMGHFPYTIDINGDGREEVLVGYSLLDADGCRIWELPLSDHADAVSILRHPSSGKLMVVIAASDEGFIFASIEGKIQKHLRLGHMQTVTIGRLIPGQDDYQIATNTFWGSPGIIYILDLDGNVLRSFQPSTFGSPLSPVNWSGTGHELLLLSAAPDETGGLYDGFGNQAVAFVKDDHPTLCYGAYDVDGDGFDELLCWDHDNMWIYRRETVEGEESEFFPHRYPPAFNDSNYRSNISITRVI